MQKKWISAIRIHDSTFSLLIIFTQLQAGLLHSAVGSELRRHGGGGFTSRSPRSTLDGLGLLSTRFLRDDDVGAAAAAVGWVFGLASSGLPWFGGGVVGGEAAGGFLRRCIGWITVVCWSAPRCFGAFALFLILGFLCSLPSLWIYQNQIIQSCVCINI